MPKNYTKRLSDEELQTLTPDQTQLLSFLSRFYFDVITKNQTGVITKPTPRQFFNFVKKHGYGKRMAKRIKK
jgi:hypothetical protein